MSASLAARLLPWRRRARRHRRVAAAALAFVAVLLLASSLAPGDGTGLPPGDGPQRAQAELADGLVAAPVRVSDAEVAGLLGAGDVVDVVTADGHGRAEVVAGGVTVLAVPASSEAAFGSGSSTGALVLLAVTTSTGVALAAAAAAGPVSVLLHP